MLDAGELRKGAAIELDGEIYQILEYRLIPYTQTKTYWTRLIVILLSL